MPASWARSASPPSELDHLCRRLAIEAIEDQPAAFRRQVIQDLITLHIHDGVKDEFPSVDEIDHAIKDLRNRDEGQQVHPAMQFDQNIATLESQ